ncbi:MAG TPA: DUF4405 domain-containing protein [Candidatus Nanoarchaeia archaeon]|nr:DUF4405 domain-containing protein [Candidatus Nanoarchaeia archaeon]
MFRYLLNILLALSFISLAATGLLKFPELQIILGLYNYPLPWRTISYLHDWSGAVLAVLILIHLWLHRRWYAEQTKNIFTKK